MKVIEVDIHRHVLPEPLLERLDRRTEEPHAWRTRAGQQLRLQGAGAAVHVTVLLLIRHPATATFVGGTRQP